MDSADELQLAGTPAGRHVPGRQKCAAQGCPKTAAVRLMVRGPDGRLYGSGCARKLFDLPARTSTGSSLNARGATVTPGTLFDQPKEQPAMSPTPTAATSTAPLTTARRFVIDRTDDPTGVSSTGTVLDGVLWPDGTVSVRWRGDDPSFVSWPSLEAAERIHCYGGLSRIVWVDEDPDDMGDSYFRTTFNGPNRATFTFNTTAMKRDRRIDLVDDVLAWATAFGLDTDRLLDNAPVTFDLDAGTITTRYVVLDPDVGGFTYDAADRPVTEAVTVAYSGTMPSIPAFLERPAPAEATE